MPTYPIDAEARGKLRAWKTAAGTRYQALKRFEEASFPTAHAFALKSGKGRLRAFEKLNSGFTRRGAHLEGVQLHGSHPIAVWAVVMPGVSSAPEAENPSDRQNGAVLMAVLAGRLPRDGILGSVIWTIETTDHALGRLLQRDRTADIDQVVLAAHHAFLRTSFSTLASGDMMDGEQRFLLPAGAGFFVCDMRLTKNGGIYSGADVVRECDILSTRARTWLHRDQLPDEQEKLPVAVEGAPGEWMGDSWLLPEPLRDLVSDNENGFTVNVLMPMPPPVRKRLPSAEMAARSP